jgi:deoxyribodipyrimidine photo-lyase
MSVVLHERAIVWLRRDLRLKDHRALFEATHSSKKVLPVFVIDENIVGSLAKNDRRITFIQKSLEELHAGLEKQGSKLLILKGDPMEVIPAIAKKLKVNAVFTAHDYEPYAKKRDLEVSKKLKESGVEFLSFKDQVIFERQEILNGSGEPYRVYTPYSNNWLKKFESNKALHLKDYQPKMGSLWDASEIKEKGTSFWDLGFQEQELVVTPGEKAAHRAIKAFTDLVSKYQELRDFPAKAATSKISIHLRFGTISIRELLRFADEHLSAGTKVWIKELIWREFYQMILDQYPYVVKGCFKKDCDQIKWSTNREHFKAWCDGMTGYPIVDAAMREFKQTGWMHNRLRMVVAMFLTKDLLINWQWGEKYFAEQLLDFDLASNNGGWQWSSSTGCDAQPYFRVMNPISQSERFDFDVEYIKKWVPELKKLNSKQIHWPHDESLFSSHSNGYPAPIVDHSVQRLKAIALFKK